MLGNALKGMEIVVKGCTRAINASNWLRMAEMSRNGRKCTGNWHEWIKLTSNGWARKIYVKYQFHVQSYAAAALAWEMPEGICDCGIPFPNWRALLNRHQLGATRLTVPPFNNLGSTVRLRFRKSIFRNHFQTIGKLARNEFNFHTEVAISI